MRLVGYICGVKNYMVPVIETRNGVKISVHSRKHLPVHIHAKYAAHEAPVNIRTSEVIEGSLPKKKLKTVTEWIEEEDVQKNDPECMLFKPK